MGLLRVLLLVVLLHVPITHGRELPHDGRLRLYHSHLDEFVEVVYERGDERLFEGLETIHHLMRSRDSGERLEISLELIHLLDHLQDHFEVDTVEIISGYRSSAFNAALKQAGRNVAENSNHIRGIAADIHFDEIPEDRVQRYLRGLNLGGVGYYPNLLMVHVDFGPKKFWQEGEFQERLDIGIFNADNPLQLKTDRLFYYPGQTQRLALIYDSDQPKLRPQLALEHFFRGKWEGVGVLNLAENSFGAEGIELPIKRATRAKGQLWNGPKEVVLPEGKIRWRIETKSGQWQHSNEFYLKRR